MRIAGSLLTLGGVAVAALGFGLGFWSAESSTDHPRALPSVSEPTLVGDAAQVRGALLVRDPFERAIALSSVLSQLGPESLDAVKSAYESVFLDVYEVDLYLMAEWWASFDPESAFAWTFQNWRARHPTIVLRIFRAWGRRDPDAAIAAAAAVADGQLRRPYLMEAIAGWEESGRPGVLEYVEAMPSGWDRQRALAAIARRMVLRDGVEDTFRWAESLPDEDRTLKLNAYRRAAQSAAELEPKAAARWAERHLDGPYGDGLPGRVGKRWGKRDPEAALEWLSTLPASSNRDRGVEDTYIVWLRHDAEAAKAWVEELPTPQRWADPAVSLYAKGLVLDDPRLALEWADKIADEQARLATIAVLGRWWLVMDEPAARAWVEQADLPDQWRTGIYNVPPGVRRQVANALAGRILPP